MLKYQSAEQNVGTYSFLRHLCRQISWDYNHSVDVANEHVPRIHGYAAEADGTAVVAHNHRSVARHAVASAEHRQASCSDIKNVAYAGICHNSFDSLSLKVGADQFSKERDRRSAICVRD